MTSLWDTDADPQQLDKYWSTSAMELEHMDGLARSVMATLPTTLLDAGCGTGQLFARIRTKVNYCGIDSSVHMKDFARSKFPLGRFEYGELTELPYRNGEFDTVTSFAVFVHLHDMRQALSELVRIARRRLLFTVRIGDSVLMEGAFPCISRPAAYVERLLAEVAVNRSYAVRRIPTNIGHTLLFDVAFRPPTHFTHVVVIPSYNRPRWLREAIDSCLAQHHVSVVVSDDGSDWSKMEDIPELYVDRVGFVCPSEHVLAALPPRAAAGRRSCLSIARGVHSTLPTDLWDSNTTLVHYLPDDDLMLPGRFARFEQFFTQHPHELWAYGPLAMMNADGGGVHLSNLVRGKPVADPDCRVDVASVAHFPRLFRSCQWNAKGIEHEGPIFRKWAQDVGPLLPIEGLEPVAAHRLHAFNLQRLGAKAAEMPREPAG